MIKYFKKLSMTALSKRAKASAFLGIEISRITF